MSDASSVAFRVDATPRLGTGHLVRCLTLATALRQRGASVVFVTRPLPPALAARVTALGAPIETIPEAAPACAGVWGKDRQKADARDTARLLVDHAPDIVVVDHYGLDAIWERAVRQTVHRIAVVDDLADRHHDPDLLVDQNWFGPATATRYDDLVSPTARLLLGPRYALLQDAYRAVRAQPPPPPTPPRLFVSFGGSDPTGETRKALTGIGTMLDRTDVEVDLVLGGASTDRDRVLLLAGSLPRTRVHSDLPSLADLMHTSTLAVGAGGATTWERICLGLPALVTAVADNQVPSTWALDRAGVLRLVGSAADTTPESYATAVREALGGAVPTPPPLVDGWGAERVATALLGCDSATVTLSEATSSDAPVFVGPDKPNETEPRSYLEGPSVWLANLTRFHDALGDSPARALVLRVDGVPMGGVLSDPRQREPIWWLDNALSATVREMARQAVTATDGH